MQLTSVRTPELGVARYAAPALQPSAEDWRAALANAEQVLGARR